MAASSIDTQVEKRKRGRKPRPATSCSVDQCGKLAKTKGLCAMHYTRMLRHGNTEGILQFGDPLERFHQKYAINPATGCWEWACYRHPKGYGILAIGKRKKVRAHRFAYERLVGPIPDGMQVCHTCDHRRCVNPGHLFLGTNQENVQDMWAKGRGARIKKRLTWPMATNIRIMYCRGTSIELLAGIYMADEETIRQVVKGLTWQTPAD
jgi:hypothetical protein